MSLYRALFLPLRFMLTDEDNPLITSPFALQPLRARKSKALDYSGSKKREEVVITHIRATDVVCGLRRLPAGFYVSVEIDGIGGKSTKTSNKPVSVGKDVVEWDEEIHLPSKPSSVISFKVYASFELGPRLGNGELLRQFNTSVGEVLECNEKLEPINFQVSADELLPSCSSLRIITERRKHDAGGAGISPEMPESDEQHQLEQLTDEGHHALLCYCQHQNQEDVNTAIACFERVQDMCPTDHPHRPVARFNLANAKFIHCQTNSRCLDLDAAVMLYRDALRLRPAGHPDHNTTALELSFALLIRLQRQSNEIDKADAMDLLAKVVELSSMDSYVCRAGHLALQMADISSSIQEMGPKISCAELANSEDLIQRTRDTLLNLPDRDPRRPAILARLGGLLCDRFEDNVDLVDIHEAVSTMERAVALLPNSHPDRSGFLSDLGRSLFCRFGRLGNLADIDRSILMFEDAVRLTPHDHPDKLSWLNNLGGSLLTRFRRLGDLGDINKSISIFENALPLTPHSHPDKPSLLNNLGYSLSSRFNRIGDLRDINMSISMLEDAVRLTPDGHPDKPSQLSNLGTSLATRFQHLGDLIDINKSISVKEEAICLVPDSHPEKPNHLNSLGISLALHFERFGNLADIDRLISVFEGAVRLTPHDHPQKPTRLNNLGNSLLIRFEHFGDIADVDRSISMKEDAVHLNPDGHPIKPGWLNNLGHALACRFQRLGNLADIDRSILTLEDAAQLTPDDHPGKACRLNSLGNSLLGRFECLGDITDINKSISMFEDAVRLVPHGHPDKPGWLDNLGNSLFHRFQRLGDLADINKSVSIKEDVVHLTPDGHPDKPSRLNNLGTSLACRFQRLGELVDINESVSMFKDAVLLTPDDHPNRSCWLNNLGISLSTRFEHSGHLADINNSILVQEHALHLTPGGHPSKPALLTNIGKSFRVLFNHSGDLPHLSSATSHFLTASQSSTGPTSVRFHAARRWISAVQVERNSHTLLDAYTTAIGLLPQLAWLGLPLTEQHRVLVDAAGVVRDAAAAALEAGHPETAVEWLEQGRSVAWSQILQLRTPVGQLRDKYSVLADEFEQISKELERASSRNDGSSYYLAPGTRSLEQEVQRHHELAHRREKLLAEIRSLPGFDRFLLPQTIERLVPLASFGPVVYLNASKQRCDAFIVTAELGSVVPVPLPLVRYQDVQVLLCLLLKRRSPLISRDDISELIPPEGNLAAQLFLDVLMRDGKEGESDREGTLKVEGYSFDDRLRWILLYLWKNVLKPILEAIGIVTPPSRPEKMIRIFWCPTGPFAFLPIHAAGRYGTAQEDEKLSDFVISSYIPALSTLAPSAQTASNGPPSHIRLVAIPQPQDDGEIELPSVKEEIDYIQSLSSTSRFINLQHSDGTIEDAMEKMTNADWVHFACHGVQDLKHPLDSGLCLANHRRLKLSDIIKLSRPQGGLAFLSACQTARGDEILSEESVHLAAGMLLAGYGGVIATMWSIMDHDAPKVTRDVYEHLFRDGRVPDATEAADALHHAVRRLRESGAPFSSWVPFIHVGR